MPDQSAAGRGVRAGTTGQSITAHGYMRWSREQAVGFFLDNVGLTERETVNEVDRYIVWPGQALAYKVGQREIEPGAIDRRPWASSSISAPSMTSCCDTARSRSPPCERSSLVERGESLDPLVPAGRLC